MVKKSDMSKAPKPEPEKVEVEVESTEKQEAPEIKVEPKFELVLPAPDLGPVMDAVKEMAAKQEPVIVQIEKAKGFKVTVTKRDYRGLIEEFECKEIT